MFQQFETFLAAKGQVKSQYIPFYIKWVAGCYKHLGIPLDIRLSVEQKKQFLAHMGKTQQDWQVKQAEAALRLYDYFLSDTDSAPVVSAAPDGDWKNTETKLVEALRLRQRSLSTEKTYLQWFSGFHSFVSSKAPHTSIGHEKL